MPMIMINGELTERLVATDRGLHYGDGLFETVAIINGRPRLWSAHMARLTRGCQVLGLPLPDAQLLYDEALSLCNGAARTVLKVMYTRGSGGRGYRPPSVVDTSVQRMLFRYPWPDYPDTEHGFFLRICQTRLACNPALAGIKHLNRLEQVMARAEWDDSSIHEGVMCDLDGWVKEGTMSNLFWVDQGQLYTPDLGWCGVAGVMRAEVMTLASDLGIKVSTDEIHTEELLTVDEIFVTNSLLGVMPVTRLEEKRFSVGNITQGLISMLQGRVEGI